MGDISRSRLLCLGLQNCFWLQLLPHREQIVFLSYSDQLQRNSILNVRTSSVGVCCFVRLEQKLEYVDRFH